MNLRVYGALGSACAMLAVSAGTGPVEPPASFPVPVAESRQSDPGLVGLGASDPAGPLDTALRTLDRLASTRVTIREEGVRFEGVMRLLESATGVVITPDPLRRDEQVLNTVISLHAEQTPAIMILDQLLASVHGDAAVSEKYDFIAVEDRMVLVVRSGSDAGDVRRYAHFYPWSVFDRRTQLTALSAGGVVHGEADDSEDHRTPLQEVDVSRAGLWNAVGSVLDIMEFESGSSVGGSLGYTLDFYRGGVQVRTTARMHRTLGRVLAEEHENVRPSIMVQCAVLDVPRNVVASVLTGPGASVSEIRALRERSEERWSAQDRIQHGGVYRASALLSEEARFHLTLSPESRDAEGRWGVPLYLTLQENGATMIYEVRAVMTGADGVILLEFPATEAMVGADGGQSARLLAITLRSQR